MRLIISFILAALMVSCATPPARAQSTYTVVATCGTPPVTLSAGAVRTGYMDTSGQICSVAAAGAGGATAANQVLQITQETAINTVLGTVTASPTANTIADRLKTINTTLGTPIQTTGGTVGLVAGVAEIGNVKNSGTFAVQSTLTAETTKVIGTVNQGTSPWVTSGAVTNAGTFAVQATLPTTPLIASGNGVIHAPTSVSTGATTRASGTAAASSLVLKGSAGNLYDLDVVVGATSGYVLLFDATALPSNGAVTPVFCDRINSDGTAGGAKYAWPMPFPFATGITAGFSTTGCFTLTASATASFFGGYK